MYGEKEIPNSIEDAIFNHAGLEITPDLTDEQIREYFTEENFARMFGSEDADISDWPWDFEELADAAIRIRNERKEGR